jgi:hypothetical protein
VNPIALCDGHGGDFVTVTGQILMAVHIQPTLLSKCPLVMRIRFPSSAPAVQLYISNDFRLAFGVFRARCVPA